MQEVKSNQNTEMVREVLRVLPKARPRTQSSIFPGEVTHEYRFLALLGGWEEGSKPPVSLHARPELYSASLGSQDPTSPGFCESVADGITNRQKEWEEKPGLQSPCDQ